MKNFCLPFCLLLLLLGASAPLHAKTVKVIAGSSLIEDIVLDLTENQADVLSVIKGSTCPGHETLKTTDFVFAAQADIILVHSFQRKMPWLTGMMEAVKDKNPRLTVLDAKGSWLIPEVQKKAVLEIAAILSGVFPQNAKAIDERARKRLARVDAAGDEIQARLAPIKSKPVAAADMQSEFASWAGLTVLRAYGQDENPGAIARMVDELRDKKLVGVVGNYQSGSGTGLPLALELAVPYIVLSNFPGSSDDALDYFSLMNHNAAQLLRLGD